MASSSLSFNEYQLFAGLVTIYLGAAGDLTSFGADEQVLLGRARDHLTKPPAQIDYDEWLPLLRDAAAIFMQKFAAAARVTAPLFEPPSPQPSPIEGEGEIFSPHSRTLSPQLTFQVTLPKTFYPKMWALPRELMAMNRKWVERGEAWDPVFFGPNHLLWWEALIRRDTPVIGPEAIVRGAELVFAQFPEDPKHQTAITKKIQRLAQGAEPFGVEVRFPTLKSWYGPVWQRALAMEAGTERDEFLLEILRAVRTEDESLFEAWVGELEKIDFDWAWGIGERAKGEGQPVQGEVEGEEGHTKKIPPPLRGGGQGEGGALIQNTLRQGQWREANQLLRQAYDAILASDSPQKIVDDIQALRQALANFTMQSPAIVPKTVPAPEPTPVGAIASQFLIPRGDLQSFINDKFLPLFKKIMAGEYDFDRTPWALMVFGQLAPFMNQDLVARLVNEHLVTKFDDKNGHNYLFLGYALATAVARMKVADVKVLVDTYLVQHLTSTASNDGRDAAKAMGVAFAKMSETEIQNIITHKLLPLLSDEFDWVHEEAIKAITVGFARMGRAKTTLFVAQRHAVTDEDEAKEVERTARVMGAAFVCMQVADVKRLIADYLVAKLDDRNEDVRMAAVAAIGAGLPRLRAAEVKDIIHKQLFMWLVKDKRYRSPEAIVTVFEAMANGFAKMRGGDIEHYFNVQLLATVADKEEDKAQRVAAIKIIGQGFARLSRTKVNDFINNDLLALLDDAEEYFVAAAVQAIGQGCAKLNGAEVKELITTHLVAMLVDEDAKVQVVEAAVQAMGQGFAKLDGEDVKALILNDLIKVLGYEDAFVRLAAIQAIQEGCKKLGPDDLDELYDLAQEKIQSTDSKEKMVGMNLMGVLAGVEVQIVAVSKPVRFMDSAEIKTYITDVVMPVLEGMLAHDPAGALKLLKLFVPHMDGTQVQAILTSPALEKLEKDVSSFHAVAILMMGELFLKMSGAEVGAVITTRVLPSFSNGMWYVRKAAVEAMGRGFAKLTGEEVKDLLANHLVKRLEDSEEEVLRAVVETMVLGLARMDETAVGAFIQYHLVSLLDGSNLTQIFNVLEVVWRSGTQVHGKSVHDLYKGRLVEGLSFPGVYFRIASTRILGKGFARMEAEDVRTYITDYLVPKLSGESTDVFCAAVQAIGLGFAKLDTADIKALITDRLYTYLQWRDADIRIAVAEAEGLGFAQMDPYDAAEMIRSHIVGDKDPHVHAVKLLALGRGFARSEDEDGVERLWRGLMTGLIAALGDGNVHGIAVQALQEVCKELNPDHRQELHALARAKSQNTDPAEKMIGMYLTGILAGAEVQVPANTDQTGMPAAADHVLQRTPHGFAITSFTGMEDALANGLIPSFTTLPVVPREAIDEADRIYIPPARDLVLFERFRRHLDRLAALIMTDASKEDRIAIRLIGPAGTGKTTFPELLAARMGIPLFTIPYSERTDPSDLEGVYKMTVIAGQKVPVFEEGRATVAMEKGYWLVLDEPDLARAGVLATTNNITAPKRRVWVKRASGHLEQIAVHPRYRVFVTENGLQELGRKHHGKDFLRRFVPIFVGDWNEAETTQVVHELYAGKDGVHHWDYAHSQLLAKFHVDMARWAAGKFVIKDGAGKPTVLPPLGSGMGQRILFSPRSILRLAQRLVKMGALTPENLSRAIRAEYILPLADPVDQELVWNQARAVLTELIPNHLKNADAKLNIGPKAIPIPTLESISQKYLQGRPIVVDDSFVWNQQALNVVDEILWNISLGIKDIFLMGPPGESKSTIPEIIAQLLGLDYYDQLVSSDMDATDLVGGPGRVNGTIGFVPGKTYLAATHGGVNHIDEALLPDTGQMEAVFNPLMDDRKALIVTSEPNVVARHPDMINIFTSNTDFGDSEDRNPMSGAAMSRMAVVQMVGDFAMSDADGAMILEARMGRPVRMTESDDGPWTRGKEGEGQIFPPPLMGGDQGEGGVGSRDLAHWRFSVDGQSSATVAERYVPLPVHPQLAEKFNIPTDLFLDTEEGKIVRRDSPSPQPSPTGGEGEIPFSDLEFFNRMADYFTRRTQSEMAQVAGRIFKIFYRLEGNFSTDLATKNIFINLLGLLKHSLEAGLGIGKHEYAHAIIDKAHPLYDAVEVLRLLANVVGDPRMNEYASSLRDDFREQVAAMCSETYPKELSADQQERFRKLLPHEQFAHGIIHAWFHGQIMPWIEDKAVITALQAALPVAGPAFFLFPESLADQHVAAAAKQFYDILDTLLPIYKELLRESDKQIVDRLQAGETMEQIMKPTPSPQPSPPSTTLGTGTRGEGEQNQQSSPTIPPPPLMGGGRGEGGNLPTGDELAELLRRIKNVRAGELNKAFAPGDPALNAALATRIAAAKDAHGGGKIVWSVAGAAHSTTGSGQPPRNADPIPLTDDQRRAIERAQAEALKRGMHDNLFSQMLPARATDAAARLKRIMPPTEPQYAHGLFMQGRRMDGKAAAQDAMDPSGTGRIMKRKTGVGKYNANFMLMSDVSGSLTQAGAVDNTLRASATVIHVAEELKMDYGEIFFGSHTIVAKPLGKRLGTYPAKNALLHSKRKKFEDASINGGTNIRKALREAIDAIKAKKAKSNFIVLVTDGEETDKTHPQTLAELRREAASEDIHLLVIALGDAKKHVPAMFYDAGEDQNIAPLSYRFAANDGADIPDILLEMIEECHKGRLPADRQYKGSKVRKLTSRQATVGSRQKGRALVSWRRVPSEPSEPREGASATSSFDGAGSAILLEQPIANSSVLVSGGLILGGTSSPTRGEGENAGDPSEISPPLRGGDQGEGGEVGTFDRGPIHSVLIHTPHAAVHHARTILLGK